MTMELIFGCAVSNPATGRQFCGLLESCRKLRRQLYSSPELVAQRESMQRRTGRQLMNERSTAHLSAN